MVVTPLAPRGSASVLQVRCVTLVVFALMVGFWRPAAADRRLLWVHSVHLGETIRRQPFDERGVPKLLEWKRFEHLWRSYHTLQTRAINGRLLRVLSLIQEHFDGKRIELLSGYRTPDGNTLTSYHQVGRAADIMIKGVEPRAIYDFCRTLPALGCGLYPKGYHVHVDVRSRAGTWVDLSHYGEPAAYVANAAGWVSHHPEAGRQVEK